MRARSLLDCSSARVDPFAILSVDGSLVILFSMNFPRNAKELQSKDLHTRMRASVAKQGQIRYSALRGRSACQWLRLSRCRRDGTKGGRARNERGEKGASRARSQRRRFLFAFDGDARPSQITRRYLYYGRFVPRHRGLRRDDYVVRTLYVERAFFFIFSLLSFLEFFSLIL